LEQVAFKIAQGIVTSDDDVFFLQITGRCYKSAATEKIYNLERAVVHPVLKGAVHMKKWVPLDTERAVIFPYEEKHGKWGLIPADKLEAECPNVWAYLLENKKRLEARESGKMVGSVGWYGYVYPKNLDVMTRPKILVPAIAMRSEYCLDAKGEYHYVGSGGGGGGGHGIVSDKVALHYLCGLLNSKLLDAFLQRVTTPFHSGWFAYSKAYIAQIPIKLPTTAADKNLAERITESVRAIMDAKGKLRAATRPLSGVEAGLKPARLSDRETKSLEAEVEAHEHRIDEAVFALYGVDELPG